MKETKSFVKCLLASGLALAMVSSLAAQEVTQVYAKVAHIKGSARYTTGNNVWLPLKAGAKLKPGTVVQTAAESSVDLVLGDASDATVSPIVYNPPSIGAGAAYHPGAAQNTVRIFQNSILGIDKLTSMETGAGAETETQLDLRQGNIMGSVKKMSGLSKYEVKLPNGVAGIKGTIYSLSADGVVRVLDGSVVIAYVGADGTVVTQVVNSGQQFDARSGQVAPIPESSLNQMTKMSKEMRIAPSVAPTFFVYDHTIYFVSPTQGQLGNQFQGAAGGGG